MMIAGQNVQRRKPGGHQPLALKRICGVCKHHSGAHIRDTGDCSKHGWRDVLGQASARDCEDFERPTVAPTSKVKKAGGRNG